MSIERRIAAAGLDWIVPNWEAPASVHGFATTRNGDARTGHLGTLDMGPAHPGALKDDARRSAILAGRALVGRFLPSDPVWLEQVHGNDVATIDALTLRDALHDPWTADAAVTRLLEVPLAIRVADCVPVLLADDRGSVVAAVHAGWRGVAAGVLEAAVATMDVEPASIVAWLGPAIGPLAFEVGAEVRDAMLGRDAGASGHFRPAPGGKWLADLPALARRRLNAAGVARVGGGGHCTVSDAGRFLSYRRDRTPARMATFVWRSAAR